MPPKPTRAGGARWGASHNPPRGGCVRFVVFFPAGRGPAGRPSRGAALFHFDWGREPPTKSCARRRQNSVSGQSRRQSMRTLQGCCGGVCAWILLVLEICGRAGGPVVLAECERVRFPRGEITEGFPQLVGRSWVSPGPNAAGGSAGSGPAPRARCSYVQGSHGKPAKKIQLLF